MHENLFSRAWLPLLIFCFLAGCPSSSEWDQRWQNIQFLVQNGRYQEAKELLHHILPSLRDNGPTDEKYGEVIIQLANIARLEGNRSQAESYYWKALPLIAQSLGPEHLRMATTLTELATLFEHKDQLKVALPLLKRALAIQEKTWGDSTRLLLPILKHYHVLLMRSDHHEEATQILMRISLLEQQPS
jgi:tetratricopeptide (TPR) repeat protein